MSSNHPHALLSVSLLSPWFRRGVPSLHRASGLLLMLLLATLLTACAREPVIHVPPRYAADARLIPPDRMLPLSDGARVPVRIWSAAPPARGLILALHGFNDSRDAWETAAPALARQGFTVWAPDQRGFGAAPARSEWVGRDRMVQDVREELALLAETAPGRPVYLMGESMGGAIALLTMASAHPPPVSGTILLAPAVWTLGPGAMWPLDVLTAVAPEGRVTGRELPVHVVASDNIAALRRLYFDPLTLHSTRLRALKGLAELMSAAARAAPRVKGPVLLVYGDRDQLVPPDMMARTWRRLPPTVRRDLIPGGYHLLLRDRAGKRVVADILSWLTEVDRFLPSGGDVAAAAWASLHDAQPAAGAPGDMGPFPLLPSQLDRLAPR